jgi:hypothetical protein
MPGGTQLPGDPAADPTRADDSNPRARPPLVRPIRQFHRDPGIGLYYTDE